MNALEPDWKQKIYNDLDTQNKYALTLKTCFEQAKKSAQNDIQAIQHKLLADANRYETIILDLRAGNNNNINFEALQSQATNKEIDRLKEDISKLLKENRDLQDKLDRSSQNAVPLMSLTLADVPSRPSLNRLTHTKEINACAFSHEGTSLATASSDCTVNVYNAKLDLISKIKATSSMNYVAYSKDDENVICCSGDNIAYMYNFHKDTNYFLEGHAGPILTADFTFDKRVITGSKDKTIKYWDFSRQYCIKNIHCTSSCTSLKVSQNLICSGHLDGKIRVWDIRNGEQTLIIPTQLANNPITSLSISPVDDKTIFVVSKHSLKTYDLTSANPVREFTDPDGKFFYGSSKGCFSPDGKCIAVGSNDGLIFVWDVEDGSKINVLTESHQSKSITCVDWSKQGKLISCDKGGNTVLWNKPHV